MYERTRLKYKDEHCSTATNRIMAGILKMSIKVPDIPITSPEGKFSRQPYLVPYQPPLFLFCPYPSA